MALGHAHRRIRLAAGLLALLGVPASAASAQGALGAQAAQGAPHRAVIAFVPHLTLGQAAALTGASVALVGPTQGKYRRAQALLDIGQGARTSLAAYDPDSPPPLRVGDGTLPGWPAIVRRADGAPAQIDPGLLGSTVPGGGATVGPSIDAATVAADRRGRFATAPDVAAALRTHRLAVTTLASPADLPAFSRSLPRGTLLLAMAKIPGGRVLHLLPIAVVGLRAGREITSGTTRTDGIVAGIDLAPTVLHWLGRPIPDHMTGRPMVTGGPLDVAALRTTNARLRVINGRRIPALRGIGIAWLALLLLAGAIGRRRGLRFAVRAGSLAVLWTLPILLLTAALRPQRTAEVAIVGAGGVLLGALTDRVVRWPRAPLLPGLVGVISYVVDLGFGSPLITRSLLGPNPLFGSRFYGIGNELEATLPVLLFVAVAALLGPRERSVRAALAFAAGGLLLGLAVGAGRLGADVGGVITIGAGTAVAVLLALPPAATRDAARRRIAIAVLVPIAAIVVLAGLDLATGGDGHFTRTILRADGPGAVEDVVFRRFELAFNSLRKGAMPVLTILAAIAVWQGIARRDRLLRDLPGDDLWGAALAGSAAAGIAGALANDSGPLLLVFAVFVTACAAAYLRAGPQTAQDRSTSP